MISQRSLWTLLGLAVVLTWALAQTGSAQAPDLANRPVADVRIEGLVKVPQQLVMNQVRQTKGSPYDPKVVEQDIVRLTHLGRFGTVKARVDPQPDGSVVLVYVVTELPLLSDVQVAGNKAIPDRELLNLILLRSGDPVDPFLIDRAKNLIKEAYQKKGHYQTDVTVDDKLLAEPSNILLFRIREGPVVRVQDIQIEGNTIYSYDQLRSKVKSETYLFIFRTGALNPEQLDRDVAAVRSFYKDAGYLDAQVGRTISVSPDGIDAVVTLVISEGPQYTVDKITIEGNHIYSDAQILSAMPIKVGDVFSADRVRKSEAAVLELYGKLGYIETKIGREPTRGFVRIFHRGEPKVDLMVPIAEGQMSEVGKVVITGNEATQDKVVYRMVRGLEPGRPFDRAGIETTQQRLRESDLFSDAKITVLGNADDPYRDVLIEVTEKRTGSVNFGAGVSSDGGVNGQFGVTQKNFDITDWPETWGELFTGKAFRGAGEFFSINLSPGTEFSNYSVSFREPALFESDYGLNANAGYFSSIYDQYDEQRLGGTVGLDKRFGDVWSAQVSIRAQDVNINSIAADAPDDVFAVEGSHALTALAVAVRRNTTDSNFFPTHGSDLQLTLSQAGALGGDYTFTSGAVAFRKYWTLSEDYLGIKTILSMRTEADYIFQPGDAPVFERFYAGGERTFRGFKFRGVGPRGIRHDTGKIGGDPIGGNFMFLWGLEYNAPIYEDYLRYVIFTDTGTVQEKFGFDEYRVSVGAGIRLKIPFVSNVPFAFDFAIPVLKQPGDEKRFFSFDVAIPF